MTLARGPGNVIDGGGLALPAKYCRVNAQVQPLSGPGVVTPGTFDLLGHYLHFRYEGNLDLGARSGGNQTFVNNTGLNPMPGGPLPDTNKPDFVPNKIIVEFDAMSEFTLPFEGHLYLIGGIGEYKFGMQVTDVVDARWYHPEVRFLRRVLGNPLAPSLTFQIPDFHTFIMGSNSADQFILPDGSLLEPGTIIPGAQIIPGLIITSVKATNVLTGWRG